MRNPFCYFNSFSGVIRLTVMMCVRQNVLHPGKIKVQTTSVAGPRFEPTKPV
jgi:hypothetical protein